MFGCDKRPVVSTLNTNAGGIPEITFVDEDYLVRCNKGNVRTGCGHVVESLREGDSVENRQIITVQLVEHTRR